MDLSSIAFQLLEDDSSAFVGGTSLSSFRCPLREASFDTDAISPVACAISCYFYPAFIALFHHFADFARATATGSIPDEVQCFASTLKLHAVDDSLIDDLASLYEPDNLEGLADMDAADRRDAVRSRLEGLVRRSQTENVLADSSFHGSSPCSPSPPPSTSFSPAQLASPSRAVSRQTKTSPPLPPSSPNSVSTSSDAGSLALFRSQSEPPSTDLTLPDEGPSTTARPALSSSKGRTPPTQPPKQDAQSTRPALSNITNSRISKPGSTSTQQAQIPRSTAPPIAPPSLESLQDPAARMYPSSEHSSSEGGDSCSPSTGDSSDDGAEDDAPASEGTAGPTDEHSAVPSDEQLKVVAKLMALGEAGEVHVSVFHVRLRMTLLTRTCLHRGPPLAKRLTCWSTASQNALLSHSKRGYRSSCFCYDSYMRSTRSRPKRTLKPSSVIIRRCPSRTISRLHPSRQTLSPSTASHHHAPRARRYLQRQDERSRLWVDGISTLCSNWEEHLDGSVPVLSRSYVTNTAVLTVAASASTASEEEEETTTTRKRSRACGKRTPACKKKLRNLDVV